MKKIIKIELIVMADKEARELLTPFEENGSLYRLGDVLSQLLLDRLYEKTKLLGNFQVHDAWDVRL